MNLKQSFNNNIFTAMQYSVPYFTLLCTTFCLTRLPLGAGAEFIFPRIVSGQHRHHAGGHPAEVVRAGSVTTPQLDCATPC